ncbi:hypothetical protein N7475_007610 [Penicillium sp. IBT 31633x]|nr:hypothetical protein N7475_007610 [Penicillium sp. IBT 31633x]
MDPRDQQARQAQQRGHEIERRRRIRSAAPSPEPSLERSIPESQLPQRPPAPDWETESTPARPAPVQPAPAQPAVQQALVEAAPTNLAPVWPAAVWPAPIYQASVWAAQVYPAHIWPTPVWTAPVHPGLPYQAHTQTAPAQSTPAKPTPVHPTPVKPDPVHLTPLQPSLSLKRKRSPSNPPTVAPGPCNAKRRNRKFCTELGHKFVGSVLITNRDEAERIAHRIYEVPVPQQVTSRLILFCDASIRKRQAAVGVVWKAPLSTSMWDGLGVSFPSETANTSVVELYAIGCALKFALDNMDSAEWSISRDGSSETRSFRPSLGRTESHLHGKTKELFVLTDEEGTLARLKGTMLYLPAGPHATEIKTICDLSELLAQRDVHVELHLSPGHMGIPGNEAANELCRKAQSELFAQSHTSNRSAEEPEIVREAVMVDVSTILAQPGLTAPSNLPLHLSLPLRPKHSPSAAAEQPSPAPPASASPPSPTPSSPLSSALSLPSSPSPPPPPP